MTVGAVNGDSIERAPQPVEERPPSPRRPAAIPKYLCTFWSCKFQKKNRRPAAPRPDPVRPGRCLLYAPRLCYCRRCNRTEEVYKLSQIIYFNENELIYTRVHLMLDCGHPPPPPYDRWEETVIKKKFWGFIPKIHTEYRTGTARRRHAKATH